mgnify:FL=1
MGCCLLVDGVINGYYEARSGLFPEFFEPMIANILLLFPQLHAMRCGDEGVLFTRDKIEGPVECVMMRELNKDITRDSGSPMDTIFSIEVLMASGRVVPIHKSLGDRSWEECYLASTEKLENILVKAGFIGVMAVSVKVIEK